MKLDWKRAGRASIAENGGFTIAVFPDYSPGEWGWKVITSDDKSNIAVEQGSRICTREAAESSAEQWLESHDRPKWHDATDWLSWAEWRGFKFYIRPTETQWHVYFIDIYHDGIHTLGSRDEAKAAAEKWVRGQGAQ